jgi:hypothetical protein
MKLFQYFQIKRGKSRRKEERRKDGKWTLRYFRHHIKFTFNDNFMEQKVYNNSIKDNFNNGIKIIIINGI